MEGKLAKRAERVDATDYDAARLVHAVLTMYYVQDLTQAEIAQRLGLSTPKVNRMLKQARQQRLVDITIRYVVDIVKDIRLLASGRPG